MCPCGRTARSKTGPIERQAEVTFDNLKRTLEAAGGSLDDVTQVLIYLTDPAVFQGMNAVYRRFFAKPYPNRATVIVAGLMVPGRGDRDRRLRAPQARLSALTCGSW